MLNQKTKQLLKEPFVRYLIMAFFIVCLELFSFWVFNSMLHISYLLATPMSIAISIVLNWYFGKRLIFNKSKTGPRLEFVLVALASLVGVGIQLATITILVESLGLRALLAKAVAIGVTFFWNFWVRSRYIYESNGQSLLNVKTVKAIVLFFYNHRFVRYLVVGGSTFAIDLALLVSLHGILKVNLSIATTISYWCSIIYNFVLTRAWTFSVADSKNLRDHAIPYSVILFFNYLFTLAFVSIVSKHINYGYAKVLAVSIQIAWTYPIYKKFVFVNGKHTSTT